MLPLQRRQGCWTIPRHRQVIAKEMPSANPHQQKGHSRDRELGMPGEMLFIETCVTGCYEIRFPGQVDRRGTFAKPFSFSRFVSRGLEADFVESFHTVSSSNVLRGMHCQLPPGDQSKLVYCVTGSVLDVVLDLRPDSPSFKSYAQVELAADRHNAVFLPRGACHGFYVRQGPACMIYRRHPRIRSASGRRSILEFVWRLLAIIEPGYLRAGCSVAGLRRVPFAVSIGR